MLVVLSLAARLGNDCIASLSGCAGGEFLMPTLVLLFGLKPKLAGSLSAISVPMMIVGLGTYGREQSFEVVRTHAPSHAYMSAASISRFQPSRYGVIDDDRQTERAMQRESSERSLRQTATTTALRALVCARS